MKLLNLLLFLVVWCLVFILLQETELISPSLKFCFAPCFIICIKHSLLDTILYINSILYQYWMVIRVNYWLVNFLFHLIQLFLVIHSFQINFVIFLVFILCFILIVVIFKAIVIFIKELWSYLHFEISHLVY